MKFEIHGLDFMVLPLKYAIPKGKPSDLLNL